ncbi:hypothetical protein E2R60_15905 [Paenibacillus dendritiformis]|uniref:hypothetical protein n=1 Tax=Paenibacillus dendritiformis TaxID=130049 RepID=UPI001059AE52|nr:hypothetical protein [Paenibacillus dendritiformis]TDL52708.1 hypothetical protein E2R60_15905 [Paenibacillus dendritiformis]
MKHVLVIGGRLGASASGTAGDPDRDEQAGRTIDIAVETFHILGGSANLVEVENAMDFSPKCEYHQVQLGFVVEQSRTRWLTHSEIAGGVIEA